MNCFPVPESLFWQVPPREIRTKNGDHCCQLQVAGPNADIILVPDSISLMTAILVEDMSYSCLRHFVAGLALVSQVLHQHQGVCPLNTRGVRECISDVRVEQTRAQLEVSTAFRFRRERTRLR